MLSLTRRSSKAFTLIELLVVIVIIAVLAVIVMPKFANRSTQSKAAAAQSDLKLIRNAIQMCQTDTGLYPILLADLTSATAPATGYSTASSSAVAYTANTWNGPYLQGAVPTDPSSATSAAFTYTDTTGTVISAGNPTW